MAQVNVTFTFHSGIKRQLFQNVRLSGSWDGAGLFSTQWTQVPMLPSQDGTGCDAFRASVLLDASQVGTTFQWGVFADGPGSPNSWVVVTEVPDPNFSQTTRGLDGMRTASGNRTVQRKFDHAHQEGSESQSHQSGP
jgi:1,4-alpha-glucan branching enzyme